MILNWVFNNTSSHLNLPKQKGFSKSFHSILDALLMPTRKISEANREKKTAWNNTFRLTECNYADSIWLAFFFLFSFSLFLSVLCVRAMKSVRAETLEPVTMALCVCNANIYLKSFECDRNGRDWEAFEKSPLFVCSSFVVLLLGNLCVGFAENIYSTFHIQWWDENERKKKCGHREKKN